MLTHANCKPTRGAGRANRTGRCEKPSKDDQSAANARGRARERARAGPRAKTAKDTQNAWVDEGNHTRTHTKRKGTQEEPPSQKREQGGTRERAKESANKEPLQEDDKTTRSQNACKIMHVHAKCVPNASKMQAKRFKERACNIHHLHAKCVPNASKMPAKRLKERACKIHHLHAKCVRYASKMKAKRL